MARPALRELGQAGQRGQELGALSAPPLNPALAPEGVAEDLVASFAGRFGYDDLLAGEIGPDTLREFENDVDNYDRM